MINQFNTQLSWTILSTIEQRIKAKIEEVGIPLKDWDISINRGVLTGLNEAFIISGEKKDELIAEDPKSAEIIRPILRGRDIKRYGYEFADLYLICTFPSKNYDIGNFPAIKSHLLSFGYERLEQSGKSYIVNGEKVSARKKTNNKWFETQDSIRYWDDFYKQKIVWGEISDVPKFCLDRNGDFCLTNTIFFMSGKDLQYLLCFLNSKVSEYFISRIGTTTGVGTVRWLKYKIETLPIPKLNSDEQVPFIMLLDEILAQRDNSLNSAELEYALDKMIYDLYGFSEEEIYIIETGA